MRIFRATLIAAPLSMAIAFAAVAQAPRARERDLGLPIGGTAGRLDAITDVAGVEVGYTTLISGEGRLVVGKGPVRTGVTIVFPRGKSDLDPVFANWYSYNGNGEMTGTTWVTEGGFLGQNDINGFHVKPEHVLSAIASATGGVPAEGNVGGGTGMTCFGFKGSTGTASRKLPDAQGGYTVGVLVQCNTGARGELRIGGVPVGRELADTLLACTATNDTSISVRFGRRCPGFEVPGERPGSLPFGGSLAEGLMEEGQGSMIVIVATDAPLLPNQILRLLKRLPAGLGREGNVAGNGDGDIFFGFSTANARAAQDTAPQVRFVSNARIAPLFEATSQALEAAITNGLLAGETMTGANYRRLYALPVQRLKAIFAKYGQPLAAP